MFPKSLNPHGLFEMDYCAMVCKILARFSAHHSHTPRVFDVIKNDQSNNTWSPTDRRANYSCVMLLLRGGTSNPPHFQIIAMRSPPQRLRFECVCLCAGHSLCAPQHNNRVIILYIQFTHELKLIYSKLFAHCTTCKVALCCCRFNAISPLCCVLCWLHSIQVNQWIYTRKLAVHSQALGAL